MGHRHQNALLERVLAMRFLVLIAATAMLGGCVMPAPAPSPAPIIRPEPQPVPQPTPEEGCNAAQYQHLVGGPLPDPFPRRGIVRVYRSDMSVTMEYDPNRLNVEIDPANRRIVSITCG
jgi:hypothetical protein